MPKVSVIMGIYNVEDTLQEALDSIMIQTFQDFEVILCDDASEDNTIKVAETFVRKYPHKVFLMTNPKNMGLNYTLNKCLEKAKGEYIARMDGDDICLQHRFQMQVDFLENNNEYALVSSQMVHFDKMGDFRVSGGNEHPTIKDFASGTPFCHAPVMIRSEAYKHVGGYTVDKKMLRVEDVNLWFKLYAAGYRGYNIQEPLYKMRDDRNATTRRKFKYRINSTYVRIKGLNSLNASGKYYPYALMPIIIGMIPKPLYLFLHRRRIK